MSYFMLYMWFYVFFFFFKQKTAYEMRISDWSSDVCSSDLMAEHEARPAAECDRSGVTNMPSTDNTATQNDHPRFFTDEQRAVVAAMLARILPTDENPGATEAGTIAFVDRYLSGADYIYAQPAGSALRPPEGQKRYEKRRLG